MYHYVSEPPANADVYRRDLSVTPASFEAQLAWLQSQGYESITLTDLVYHPKDDRFRSDSGMTGTSPNLSAIRVKIWEASRHCPGGSTMGARIWK